MRSAREGLKILMAAGEVSGDLQGSHLACALLSRDPSLYLFGTGGPKMREAGVDLRIETTRYSSVGLSESLRFVRPLRGVLARMREIIASERPDAAILIDNHGFNMALAKFLNTARIPVVYYFPPQAWVGSWLFAGAIARRTNLIVSAFEREAAIYRHHGGRAVCVGHPLLDIAMPGPDPEARLRSLGVDPSVPLIAMMPGSRIQEVERLAGPMFGAARIIKSRIPDVRFLLPIASQHLKPVLEAALRASGNEADFTIIEADVYSCLSLCSLVLTTSGTSTLETALLGVPMVVAYRLHPVSYWLGRRLANTRYLAMPNLLLNNFVVPEILQGDVNAATLADEALGLLGDPVRMAAIRSQFATIPSLLGGTGALNRIADLVLGELEEIGQKNALN